MTCGCSRYQEAEYQSGDPLPPRIPILMRVQTRIAFRTPILPFKLLGGIRTRFQSLSEDAIKAVAASPWARNLAAKEAQLLGFSPGTPEYDSAVNMGSRNLAIKFLGGTTGAPAPVTAEEVPAGPGRPKRGTGKTTR